MGGRCASLQCLPCSLSIFVLAPLVAVTFTVEKVPEPLKNFGKSDALGGRAGEERTGGRAGRDGQEGGTGRRDGKHFFAWGRSSRKSRFSQCKIQFAWPIFCFYFMRGGDVTQNDDFHTGNVGLQGSKKVLHVIMPYVEIRFDLHKEFLMGTM